MHQALGYALGPREVFRLEKFSPEEATEVLAVIAETEELPFDKRFITELTQQELASREDGLILPVDLQVLAWTVNRQNMSELRAFNRLAFQKIGGIEGLLTRFLERILDARVTSTQRQAAVKVLLALTDLDRQVRAGVLTVAALQTKLKDTLQPEAVAEATTWLARPDVRLITPVNSAETAGYELSHERLIPALMRLAGKELSEADRVNQLLDRRVNEWLGNQRSRRYLFNWRELRLIQRHKPYLIWGAKRKQKERLIAQSQRSVYGRITAVLAISLSILLGWLWLSSPTGIIWQTRRELVQLSGKVPDETAVKAAIALAMDGKFSKALKIYEQSIQNSYEKDEALSSIFEIIGKLDDNAEASKSLSEVLDVVEKIDDSNDKADVLGDIVEIIGKLDDNAEARKLLSQALSVAEKIDNPYNKAWVLRAIAQVYVQLENKTEAKKLLSQALTIADKMDDSSEKAWALTAIAQVYVQLENKTEVGKLLSQTLTIADKMDDSDNYSHYTVNVLMEIAKAIGKLGDNLEGEKLLSEVWSVAEKNNILSQENVTSYNVNLLNAIASAIGKLDDHAEAKKFLAEVVIVAEKIDDFSNKAWALSEINIALAKLSPTDERSQYLKQALIEAEKIDDSDDKAKALSAIAETQANFGNWRKAHHAVSFCTSNDCRVQSGAKILTVWAQQSSVEDN